METELIQVEQVVKRYWTTTTLPDVQIPAANVGWLAILVGATLLWLVAFRPRHAVRA